MSFSCIRYVLKINLYIISLTLSTVVVLYLSVISCILYHISNYFSGGKTEQSTHIKIKRNPTAQILGPHTLSRLKNSELQLVCAVDSANLIVWRAPNNTALRSVAVNGSYNDVLAVRNVTSDGTWTCTALRGSMKGET